MKNNTEKDVLIESTKPINLLLIWTDYLVKKSIFIEVILLAFSLTFRLNISLILWISFFILTKSWFCELIMAHHKDKVMRVLIRKYKNHSEVTLEPKTKPEISYFPFYHMN